MTISEKLSVGEREAYFAELDWLVVDYDDSVTREEVVYALRNLAEDVEEGRLV